MDRRTEIQFYLSKAIVGLATKMISIRSRDCRRSGEAGRVLIS